MKKTLAELRQRRAAALKAWRTVVDTAEKETRDLNADEQKTVDERQAEVQTLDKQIEQRQALDEAERAAPAAPAIVGAVGDGEFAERARKDFRVTRALAGAIGIRVDDGLERELSAECAQRRGKPFAGVGIPDEALLPPPGFERRVQTTGSASSLYPEVHRPDLAIELLRAPLIVERLGAVRLTGLVGTQDIPKQIGSSATQWLDEEEALDPSDAVFDDVVLTPHTIGSLTSVSRRLLINAQPSIEALIRADLSAIIAQAIDLAAIAGSGMDGMPAGITVTTDVHQVSMPTPTWAKVLEMIAEVEAANALAGSLGWALAPGVKKALRSIPKVEDGEEFIMTEPGSLAGYPVASTSLMPGDSADSPPQSGLLIFGAWQNLLIGEWSGIDILPNALEGEAYRRGRVWLRAMKDCDAAIRHGQAFAVCDDINAELVT